MITPEMMKILRCPMDPKTELTQQEHHLVCQQCEVKFPIRDGFPSMLIEEAELPHNCSGIEQLPCQLKKQQS